MIRKILLTLAALVAVLVVAIALQPAEFRVSRSAVLPAAPSVVFSQVNDLRKWEAWSPWAKLDPDSQVSFTGPAEGEGSSMSWKGNDKVGEGTMTVTESKPDERVALRLDFVKPFAGTSQTEFTFQPEAEASHTRVTWTMTGTNQFVGKAIGLIMNCDKIVGGQFEEGLANMRAAVAKSGQP